MVGQGSTFRDSVEIKQVILISCLSIRITVINVAIFLGIMHYPV